MALLSYGSSPQKGSSVTVTLDTALLLSLNAVTADPFWAGGNDGDVTQAIVTLKTNPGNGKIVLTFDVSQDPCTATLTLPQYCRNNFEISKIVLIDTMGDKLTLGRDALLAEIPTLAESEISISSFSLFLAGTKETYILNPPSSTSNQVYWEGGSINDVFMPSYPENCYVSDVKIASDGTIYACGASNDSFSKGEYWVNGVRTPLEMPPSVEQTFVRGIEVNGTDVYVVGSIHGTVIPISGGGYTWGQRAAMWVNGVYTPITLPNQYDSYSELVSVKVSPIDGSVHACGWTSSDGAPSSSRAIYCVEGTASLLPFIGPEYGQARDIAISDTGTVYILGYQTDGTYLPGGIQNSSAVLWVNSVPELLTKTGPLGETYEVTYGSKLKWTSNGLYIAGAGRDLQNPSPGSGGFLSILWQYPNILAPISLFSVTGLDYSPSEAVPYVFGQDFTYNPAVVRNDTLVYTLESSISGSPLGAIKGTSVYVVGASLPNTRAQKVQQSLVGSSPNYSTIQTIEGRPFIPGVTLNAAAKNSTITMLCADGYYPNFNVVRSVITSKVGAQTDQHFAEGGYAISEDPNDLETNIHGATLDGTVAYACGQALIQGITTPVIWTNGSISALDMGIAQMGYAEEIATYNGSVYVLGQIYDGYWKTVVWQDGAIAYELMGAGETESYGYSIYVDATGVYVGGVSISNFSLATVWKDGAVLFVDTPSPDGWGAEIYALTINNGTVVASGTGFNSENTYDNTQVWEIDSNSGGLNSTYFLPTGDYLGFGYGYSVTYGPDGTQYIAGSIYYDEFYLPSDPMTPLSGQRAALWTDGNLEFLPNPTVFGSAIFVKGV